MAFGQFPRVMPWASPDDLLGGGQGFSLEACCRRPPGRRLPEAELPPPPQATRDRDRDAARSRDNARFLCLFLLIVFHKIFRDLTYPVGDFIVFHCAQKQGTILRFLFLDCFLCRNR